jgi:D-alanyl-lipoteichoic acid acyltransferase DltB (MBOAT superfamily)
MLFNSISFLIFFPVVTGLYFLLPQRLRWVLLLAASCVFYMFFIPIYILILFVTITIDYFAGIYIEKSRGRGRVFFLSLSIVSLCAFLFSFKYFNFFNANFAAMAHFLDLHYPIPALKIILPIGLSFHTFQSLSYVIEVYRGNQKAERNFGIYALYVMFYPQLVAGPIERPQHLLHQFYERHRFEPRRVVDGLKLMLWGMFKKVVIADRLAVFVNQVYDQPHDYTGLWLILATVFFAFQIYCDFSGYSDIAIGAAQVMGFRLMQNFNRPYFAKSIAEFWKRWHISLSTWFRDYLYIPLGGNRVSPKRWYLNLFITFLVSGLWHGANWTYVVWGALNGAYLITGIWYHRLLGHSVLPAHSRLGNLTKVLGTFALTCFAWIFFRARSIGDALYIIRNLFRDLPVQIDHLAWTLIEFGHGRESLYTTLSYGGKPLLPLNELLLSLALIGFLIAVQFCQRRQPLMDTLASRPIWVRWPVYYAGVMVLGFFGVYHNAREFIYFQF